ncbi:MAG: peptide-methionine (S)-S-oxide reductase MsrA [Oxalobacter formigenes]|nr:peptide-methionine (S)-S-oxide reductase MsrA [Oxalobacter formigenes]
MATEFATLGGGCFWCLEAIFQEVKGVESVISGYSGGQAENPSYEIVSQGTTGHAEVVNITFDPAVISYRELLRLFFTMHDPTTPNRQGNDIGPQYRSVIYYHTPEQKKTAREVMSEMAGVWSSPIVTHLGAFTRFYPAEDFLQNFFRDNPEQGYCLFAVAPKVAQFRRMFTGYLKK